MTSLVLALFPQVQENEVTGLVDGRICINNAHDGPRRRRASRCSHACCSSDGASGLRTLDRRDARNARALGILIDRAQGVDTFANLALPQHPHKGGWSDALEDLISRLGSGGGRNNRLLLGGRTRVNARI